MNSSLQKIEIRNFKAFREFTLDFSSPNLLVYGSNGSGKSSLYWALYTFLQSACKPKDSISKYFAPNEEENLLNIHEQKESAPKDGEIVLTLHDATKGNIIYSISNNVHGTHNESVILKGDLASDFITYRFFFGFSHFRNSENFNIWPLFEKEILPFCVTRGGRPRELEERWKSLLKASPNSNRYRGKAGAKAFRVFNAKLKDYSESLKLVVNDIRDAAQIFYDTYFAEDDSAKISLKLCITAVAYHSQQCAELTICPFYNRKLNALLLSLDIVVLSCF